MAECNAIMKNLLHNDIVIMENAGNYLILLYQSGNYRNYVRADPCTLWMIGETMDFEFARTGYYGEQHSSYWVYRKEK